MSETFYFSDPHFAHDKVAGLRGFASTHDHDRAVLQSLYDIPRNSTLWGVGDLTNGRMDAEDRALGLMRDLAHDRNLYLVWIYGNHDTPHGNHSTGFKQVARWAQAFNSLPGVMHERKMEGHRVIVSHFPYNGDSEGRDDRDGDGSFGSGDRYLDWRPRDMGKVIFHGHTHQEKKTSRSVYGTLQISVGWDAWRRPVAQHELARLIKQEYHHVDEKPMLDTSFT